MRCKCCDTPLSAFDDFVLCKICIRASEDDSTPYKDKQHILLTDDLFRKTYKPRKPYK